MGSGFRYYTFETLDEHSLNELNVPGVYAFYLNALRPRSIKLDPARKNSFEDLEKARIRCISILEKVTQFLMNEKKLKVDVQEVGYTPMRFGDTLTGSVKSTHTLINRIRQLEVAEFEKFIGITSLSPTIIPPIYVGMTADQTIKTRYRQHKNAFEIGDKATFGGRFYDSGFAWNDLVFACLRDTKTPTMSKETLTLLESYIHFFQRPIYGKL